MRDHFDKVKLMIAEHTYQREDPFQESRTDHSTDDLLEMTRGPHYILVEFQRHLGILDADHGMIELVIPVSTCA